MAERIVLDGSSGKTKAETEHVNRVVGLGCVVCRLHFGITDSPAEVMHLDGTGLALKTSWFEVLPMCPRHHRTGGYGIAYHAGDTAWVERYGRQVELLAAVELLLDGESDADVRSKFDWPLRPRGSVLSPRPLREAREAADQGPFDAEEFVAAYRRGRDWGRIVSQVQRRSTGDDR